MKEKDKKVIDDLANTDIETVSDGSLAIRLNDKLIDGLFDKSRTRGMPTGFSHIDQIMGGLRAGSLTVFGASTGMGKSVLALNILIHINRDLRLPVVYIDLENGVLESTERIIRIWFADELTDDFFNYPEKYKDDVAKMTKEIFSDFYYYSHDNFETISQSSILRLVKYHALKGQKIFLIDPLQAIPGDDVLNTQEEEGNIVKELKNLAQELNLTIILCHHIRKTVSGGDTFVKSIADIDSPKLRVPSLDDLRGSGKIGDYATGVWTMVRINNSTEADDRNKTLFRILKNRFGNLGDVRLVFNPMTLTFRQFSVNETVQIIQAQIEKKKKYWQKSAGKQENLPIDYNK